jgi:catechol 2,3-dioxygenase-like lactoylglutathione lyase family enzyme
MNDHPGMDALKGGGWQFHHLGVVVRDLDLALEKYRALGLENGPPETHLMEGRKAALRGATVKLGPLALEIWQPLRGYTIQQAFLEEVGEGVNHVCFYVEDIARERARLAEKGIRVVWSAKNTVGEGSYFDTRAFCNLALELVQPAVPPGGGPL